MKKKIERDDFVITAWAETVSGPGWSNAPLYVLVRSRDGALRVECYQPQEQTADMLALYPWSSLAHRLMRCAVEDAR